MNDKIFSYRYKGKITIEGYGCERVERSAESPGGMIDKTRTGADGLWVVVPLADVVSQ
jgi:hypothetical protein